MELRETEPFEFETHIRYSEVDERSLATLPAIIDLFQDCSTFQSESLGVGMAWLKERGVGWVLAHWRIVIDRRPSLYETVSVGTFAHRFKSVMADRDFYLRDSAGKLIVRARSNWAFVDLATGRPARPAPEHVEPYGIHEPLDMPPAPRKIALPDAFEDGAPIVVRQHHIDTNGHVNNCEYVREALDLLPIGNEIRTLRVDYRRAAVLGDVMHPRVAREQGRFVVELDDGDGLPFALVELREEGAE